MAEQILFDRSGDRISRYRELIPQIRSLVTGEPDLIANLSNIAAALKSAMDFFWVGFYIVRNNQLVLGPFQGPVACTRIAEGRGVCGTAMKLKQTLIVADVNNFPGHIACSADSKSEIVLPVLVNEEVVIVLDVDSDQPNYFDKTDEEYLGMIVDIVKSFFPGK